MGLFLSIQEWKMNRYEKRMATMEAKGICPDCNGRGMNILSFNEYYLTNDFDCPGCNGSGLYTDWHENNQ
ncbi:hypothetical protein J6TS2_49650 [Heyndrickxia sporothermodurans]|nr:hypothetical protein J6TS2_49650 [Heyndrickxia sporothermodurans]